MIVVITEPYAGHMLNCNVLISLPFRVLKPTGKLVLLTSTSIENLLRRTASKSPILTSGEHNDSGCCDQRTTLIDNDVGHDTNDVFKNGEADHLSKAAHENTYTCIEQTDEPCDKSVKVCKSFCKEDNSHSNSYGHDRIILDTGKLEEFNSSTKDSELSSERVLVDENSQNLKALDKTHGILETVETSESFKADIADKEQVLGNEIPQNLKTLDETRGISKTVETLKSVKADIVDKEQVSVNDIPQTLKALDGTHGISETVETSESVKADIADKERVSVNDIPQNLKALDGTSKAFKFCEISEAVETSESLKADIVVKDTCSAEDKMKQQQGNETSESVKADIVVKDTGSAEDKMKQQGKETIDLCDTYSSSEIIGDEKVNIQKDSKMQNLVLLESHYIKLGETDSYVCVFEKQDRI